MEKRGGLGKGKSIWQKAGGGTSSRGGGAKWVGGRTRTSGGNSGSGGRGGESVSMYPYGYRGMGDEGGYV